MIFSTKKQNVVYTYEAADLEQVLKVEALIDTRIDKVLARIARMKEFDRLYSNKDVTP